MCVAHSLRGGVTGTYLGIAVHALPCQSKHLRLAGGKLVRVGHVDGVD